MIARFMHHITIPGSVLVAMVSVIIGLATSYEWSYKVTGTHEYMMMLFDKLNPEVIIVLFSVIILFSIFPLFMGFSVSGIVTTDSSTPNIAQYILTLISMLITSAIITILMLFIGYQKNKFFIYFKFLNHLNNSSATALVISFLLLFGLSIAFIYKNKMNLWAWLLVPVAAFIGGAYGILIMLADVTTSSLSHTTSFLIIAISIYTLCFTALLMLSFGIIIGNSSFYALFYLVFFSSTISIFLIFLDTPQNIIMRLNNGIVPVYKGLDRGITRAIWREKGSSNYNYQCAYKNMYTINENGETLFSCREKIYNNKNNSSSIPKNKYYRGIIINNVTNKIIFNVIGDKIYKELTYNVNCIRRIDGQFLCEREVVVPFFRSNIDNGS